MNFLIRNNAKIANKYIRFAKWKLRKLHKKFSTFDYTEIFIQQISNQPSVYYAVVKLGVRGPDLVVSAKADNLKLLWAVLFGKIKRQLRKHNSKTNYYN